MRPKVSRRAANADGQKCAVRAAFIHCRNGLLSRRPQRLIASLTLAGASCIAAGPALAQYLSTPAALAASIPDASTFLAKNTLAPFSPFPPLGDNYTGVPAGSWTIYPFVGSSLQYSSNIQNSSIAPIADMSAILTPTVIATRNEGIQNTLVYGTLTNSTYFDTPKADYTNVRLGFEHLWEARRDLVFTATGDLVRESDLSTGVNSFLSPNGNAFVSTTFLPVESMTARGGVAMLKYAGPWFFNTSANASETTFSNSTFENGVSLDQKYRDSIDYTITQRVGYSLDSDLYVFEDSVLDIQNTYLSSGTDSTGERETIGIGALQFRTLSGELFAGYQIRNYASSQIGAVSDPVVGGKITWEQRKYLLWTLSADQTLQTANIISPSNPTPSAVKVKDFGLNGSYSLSAKWQAGLNLKYESQTYINNPQSAQIFGIGLNWQYTLNRAVILTLNLQHNRLVSSIPTSGVVADTSAVGLTYRY